MKKLKNGDKIFAYLKGQGYVGYGEIISNAVIAKEFILEDATYFFDNHLKQPNIKENKDNPNMADWGCRSKLV
ncbi:hypothetical protein GH741_02765 [Aquibacillus halophilus]|uniref:Uncharacterized protein n=1 Tax=Aquibacillus halophilus TaxID=930132 RepID=A0A6A8D760_9BACI|nr:hypothetical protein [Aquibacillus halophilus]MRH41593.1 hypothetical protein [Aquibacillus halophilus]